MGRIGILGGTFDPPHLGHLLIAEEVRIALDLDEVWFIPSNKPPHKQEAMTDAQERVEMLERAIKSNSSFKINTLELKRLGKSYTFDTMNILKKEYPETRFYFIIGADMVEYLPKWQQIDELMNLVTFVGVKRPGYYLDTTYPIIEINIPIFDISSTFIKKRLANNETVTYLLPEPVYTYIKEKRLYANK